MENKDVQYLSDTCVFGRDVYESAQSENKPGILRVIQGPVAEYEKLNRNKRKYSEKLWDKVLASPYVQEQLRYKTLYGEANHPTDRYEVDFMRVSHSITEMWKVPASSQIFATINILDTPAGRVINTLYEAGGIIGYSSRAGGTLTPKKGYTDVDVDSYNFVTFDAVPFPSVESARPSIVEGTEIPVEKESLPDDIHEKLCKIISESNTSEREVIKDLIYNLEGYDFGREVKLLEESNPIIPVKSEPEKETTMSLLKESSLQIDKLRSENRTLQTRKSSLEKENDSLRKNLDSSLNRITQLMEESKSFEGRIQESTSQFDDTIRDLRDRVHNLEGELEDKNLEIDYLSGVHEAFRALQYENKRLSSDVQTLTESAERAESERYTKAQSELNEACREVSTLIEESDTLTKKLQDSESINESLRDELECLKRENKELKDISEQNADMIAESANKYKKLEDKNSDLESEIRDLSESFEQLRQKTSSYRDDLISVICSGYNLTTESVKKNLPAGFTKSDIYIVCESMSNSQRDSISYASVVSEDVHESDSNKSNINQKPNISFVNRRGIGLIN